MCVLCFFFFFSSRRRHTRLQGDWSSDVCSSDLYGHEAEAMLSQPATKIFLATSEPNAARWISDAIGEIETERLTESRSSGRWGRRRNSETQNLQRQREPLVIPSEITGLQPLHGYLKHRNLVVR